MRRLALLPVLPISGEGESRLRADLGRRRRPLRGRRPRRAATAARGGSSSPGPSGSPTTQIARLIARAAGRDRPLVHIPLGLVQLGLAGLRRAVGDAVFATWEEAELMEVPMVSRARDRRRRGARGRAAADGRRARRQSLARYDSLGRNLGWHRLTRLVIRGTPVLAERAEGRRGIQPSVLADFRARLPRTSGPLRVVERQGLHRGLLDPPAGTALLRRAWRTEESGPPQPLLLTAMEGVRAVRVLDRSDVGP